jgi:hypothetical protein
MVGFIILMATVILIAPCPEGQGDVNKLRNLADTLGPLPDGVQQPAANGWIVDVETALDVLLKSPKTAEGAGQTFQGLNIPARPNADT